MGRVRNCGYEEDQRTLDGGLVFLFFIVTNRSVVFYYSKVKGVAPCDALLGYNNNYLRSKNDVDLSPVEGLFRPSTLFYIVFRSLIFFLQIYNVMLAYHVIRTHINVLFH